MKCSLCNAEQVVPFGETAQTIGWSQIAVSTPARNAYLTTCPSHGLADVIAWIKGILKGKA